MDFVRLENVYECRAYPDDEQLLKNMLEAEDRYIPSYCYFQLVQREVTPELRNKVAKWMLEICTAENCQEEVFAVSVNYLDRFLSVRRISESDLKVLALACLLLASKLRETQPMSAERLSYRANCSILPSDITEWEKTVASTLKRDISAVTPQEFLPLILSRLPINMYEWNLDTILRKVQQKVSLCIRDFSFIYNTPSMVACASIAAALESLEWTKKSGYTMDQLLDELHKITEIEKDILHICKEKIDYITIINQLEENRRYLAGTGTRPRIKRLNLADEPELRSLMEKLGISTHILVEIDYKNN